MHEGKGRNECNKNATSASKNLGCFIPALPRLGAARVCLRLLLQLRRQRRPPFKLVLLLHPGCLPWLLLPWGRHLNAALKHRRQLTRWALAPAAPAGAREHAGAVAINHEEA